MRTGPLNSFTNDTRAEFVFNYRCWECPITGRGLDAHHIMGRGSRNSDLESSPLNLAPLDHKCHSKGDVNSFEKRQKYLQKTLKYLLEQGYTFTEKDKKFLIKYKKYYQNKIV